MSRPLIDILAAHGTDKHTSHSYGTVYADLFAPIRTTAEWVFEIGVCEGNSLRAWREYFSRATIVGMDNEDRWIYGATTGERIEVYLGDQKLESDVTVHARTRGIQYDVVIDDGSHDVRDQVLSLFYLWPYLKPGGFYVIEDVQYEHQFPCWGAIAGAKVLDRRSVKGRFDDIMVIVQKGTM